DSESEPFTAKALVDRAELVMKQCLRFCRTADIADIKETMSVKAKIGFIGSSAPSSPHHESVKAFIPKDIDITFVQEKDAGGSLYDARGKVDSLIRQATELAGKHAWDGVIISGGPREVLNPGLSARLSSALKVPVATALSSSTAALKVFSA